jgi:hypothetical protein
MPLTLKRRNRVHEWLPISELVNLPKSAKQFAHDTKVVSLSEKARMAT